METYLTAEETDQALEEAEAYIKICPPLAKAHAIENHVGFITGWICRAAFEKEQRHIKNKQKQEETPS